MTPTDPLKGVVLDESLTLTLHEVCEVCGVEESIVIEMVREGIAEPIDATASKWQFTGVAAARIRTAHRLRRGLDVNLPGAALALELLEQIDELERRRKR